MSEIAMKDRALGDSSRLWQALAAVVLLIVAVLMLRNIGALLAFAGYAPFYPYSLDYGEGIVWQQMRDIMQGVAYGPLGVFPAIVYHYPPVFHLTAAAAAALTGADQLAAGRAVEMISTFASALLVAWLTIQAMGQASSRWITLACGASAALLFLNCNPVIMWAPLMRVDMLSGALGLLGLALAIKAVTRPVWIYAAAVAFVLSVYTKQISIAAPMAAFGVMLLVDWRTALRGLVAATVLGLIVLGALSWMTDGGFARHIFLYNVNRLDLTRLTALADGLTDHLPLLALAAFGLGHGWRRLRPAGGNLSVTVAALKADPVAFAVVVLTVFLAIKTLMLPTILKSGSSYNYLIEWLSAVAVFSGMAMRPILALAAGTVPSRAERIPLLVVALALIALVPKLAVMPVWSMNQQLSDRAAALAVIVPKIAAASKPVIADDMTLLIRAGRKVQWEPAIAAELAHTGIYDEGAFVRMIEAGAFAFFVTEGKPGDSLFDERYNAPVRAAIKSAYPIEQVVGDFVLHLPR
jgi:hypothetical protein